MPVAKPSKKKPISAPDSGEKDTIKGQKSISSFFHITPPSDDKQNAPLFSCYTVDADEKRQKNIEILSNIRESINIREATLCERGVSDDDERKIFKKKMLKSAEKLSIKVNSSNTIVSTVPINQHTVDSDRDRANNHFEPLDDVAIAHDLALEKGVVPKSTVNAEPAEINLISHDDKKTETKDAVFPTAPGIKSRRNIKIIPSKVIETRDPDSAKSADMAVIPTEMPHPQLDLYVAQLDELVSEIGKQPIENEPDFRQGIEIALDTVLKVGQGDSLQLDDISPLIARLVQGRRQSLSSMSADIADELKSLLGKSFSEVEISSHIRKLAERRSYGSMPRGAVITEDDALIAIWRWEVVAAEELLEGGESSVKGIRQNRTQAGKHVRALSRLIEIMKKNPLDAAKISVEEEKVAKIMRQAEAERQKHLLYERNKLAKEEEKRLKAEAKAAEKAIKTAERESKQESAQKAKKRISVLNFFKKTDNPAENISVGLEFEKEFVTESSENQKNRIEWSTSRAETFNSELKEGLKLEELLEQNLKSRNKSSRFAPGTFHGPPRKRMKFTVSRTGGVFEIENYTDEVDLDPRMKLLSFSSDIRPAYWGTFSKKSTVVNGRHPFGQDPQFDYDYDSEASWSEGDEEGEELKSEDELEPEDEPDYNDGWMRYDDEFSDSELLSDTEREERAHRPSMRAVIEKEGGLKKGKLNLPQRPMAFTISHNNQDGTISLVDAKICGQPEHSLLDKAQLMDIVEQCRIQVLRPIPIDAHSILGICTMQSQSEMVNLPESYADEGVENKLIPARRPMDDELTIAFAKKVHGSKLTRAQLVEEFLSANSSCSKNAVNLALSAIATKQRSAITGVGMVWLVNDSMLQKCGMVPTMLLSDEEHKMDNAEMTSTPHIKANKGAIESTEAPLSGQKSLLNFLKPDSNNLCTPEKVCSRLNSCDADDSDIIEVYTPGKEDTPTEKVNSLGQKSFLGFFNKNQNSPTPAKKKMKFYGPFDDGGWAEHKECGTPVKPKLGSIHEADNGK